MKGRKIEIEIPDGKRAEWVDGVLTLVDDKPKDVTERVKTFEDACAELGEGNSLVMQYRELTAHCSEDRGLKDIIAYLKLRIICAALNEGRQPTNGEKPYWPMFCYLPKDTGSWLSLKSKELADYCGRQFIDIWADFVC